MRFLHLNMGKCSVTLNHASPSGRPLPIQVLLNNLPYDVSEIAVPFDRVDPEATARPVKWDVKLIERFMLVFGPVSAVFDFLTFYALLHLFGAGEGLFQTGWFTESITTQVSVVFAIRTRRRFFRSKPHPFLVALAFGAVAIATVLLLLPVGQWFDLAAPPPLFFVFLASATVAYLGLAEITKGLFYRYTARRCDHPAEGPLERPSEIPMLTPQARYQCSRQRSSIEAPPVFSGCTNIE